MFFFFKIPFFGRVRLGILNIFPITESLYNKKISEGLLTISLSSFPIFLAEKEK